MTTVPTKSKVLRASRSDVQKLLAAHVTLGTKNVTHEMRRYVCGRTKDGVHVFNMHMTWEKIMLAARIIVAIHNPQDVVACSTRQFGQRAIFKFAQCIGANYLGGRFIPGTFSNQIQPKFMQPRVLIVTDPRTDHQAVSEASLTNVPVIALCDTDSPLRHVDVVLPCNNRGRYAIGMVYWFLAREVLRMRNTVQRSVPWEIQVDLFFYRDPELKREDQKGTVEKPEEFAWGDYGQDVAPEAPE